MKSRYSRRNSLRCPTYVDRYIEKHRVQLETERRARDAESFSRSVESAIAQHEETKRREDAAVYGQAVTYREKISREFPAWQRIVRRELTGDVPRLLQGVFMNSAKDVSSAVEVCDTQGGEIFLFV